MFFLHIVDLDFFTSPHAGVVRGKPSCLLEGRIRQFVTVRLDDHVGAGRLFGVKPPVVSRCKVKSEFIILEVVLSYIYMVAVTRNIVERRVFYFYLFLCKPPLNIAGIYKLFPDSGQIVLGQGDVKCSLYGFQIGDVIFCLTAQFGECLERTLLFIVLCKIALCIFLGSLRRVKASSFFAPSSTL